MSTSTHYIRSIHTQFTTRSTAWAASSPSVPHPHHTWGQSQNPSTHYSPHAKPLQGVPNYNTSYSSGRPQYHDVTARGDWRNTPGSPYTHSRRRTQRLHSMERDYHLLVSKSFSQFSSPSHSLPSSQSPQGRSAPLILPYRKTTFDPFFDDPLETTPLAPSPTSLDSPLLSTEAFTPPSQVPAPITRPIQAAVQPTAVSQPKPAPQVAAKSREVDQGQQSRGETTTTRSTTTTIRTSPPTTTDVQKERDARTRLVAGILLNKVHAVGKPMRRRPSLDAPPRQYVKSNLSNSTVLCSA